jgi:two-component system CheB/CheR fusion protein
VPEGILPKDVLTVGIGCSAGGLRACQKLVEALGTGHGMRFILIQHLDPTHESMMVDLLADRTSMTVLQAADGMQLESDHVYVIPPGAALSVRNGALHLSQPTARHCARLPFDFLLHSLAEEYGTRAVCVILSGSGADGSLGLLAIREKRGLVIVQDPQEAGFDGMPRSAIRTGAVDLVLPIAEIGEALIRHQQALGPAPPAPDTGIPDTGLPDTGLAAQAAPSVQSIIDLLRTETPHDFRLYKQGTLQRRIERRMAMAGIAANQFARYIEMLRATPGEAKALADDLLINVTSFFRDPRVFDFLAARIIPDLVHSRSGDHPLRVWIAGCSTGEETYSLAILFREAISAANLNVKLQVFASDVDPDAVAHAREGLYPEAAAADISPARLARFFIREDAGYRVVPDLRACVVFTVQDLLSDPPFSRIDLVSCRNLLIYLKPEAQAKVMSVFHFALREGGILLLGTTETVGGATGRFEPLSKAERVYRHIARSRPGELDFIAGPSDGMRPMARPGVPLPQSRQSALAELCRRLVMEHFAPAAILINRRNECLFSMGPTERYLRVASGHATHDLLAMVGQGLRTRLRGVIETAIHREAVASVAGGRITHGGKALWFNITVQPVRSEPDDENLLLVCFTEEPRRDLPARRGAANTAEAPRVAVLERELEATKAELQGAIRNLEAAGEEQKVANEEALSVNEEYQSTNEELLTSKEELQSLNEELTALNGQLQETLERQRTTSNDLQNILYSTDIATLFLDARLDIRFFTPSTRAVFSIIPGDIGRPLADLQSLAGDTTLLSDARTILRTSQPIEREIETKAPDADAQPEAEPGTGTPPAEMGGGRWYIRRVSPYRTHDSRVEGVVITFTDITERKRAATALQEAQLQSEMATLAKSRFLAAASHDLRQPLQTLALLQGLLARKVEGAAAQKLVALLDPTLNAMSGMLNTLLDINQIDAGMVSPERSHFAVDDMLARLRDEFAYIAQARELGLRVVRSGLFVYSDPRLLEQILRNLISNALKYTRVGRVLLGCRRRGGALSIEVWDTGIGIPPDQISAIFGEYHQVDNAARERDHGLGLGLSIVQRLADLLGHRMRVASRPGKGSMFAIEIAATPVEPVAAEPEAAAAVAAGAARRGTILVIEDDPDLRELLEQLLTEEGHLVSAVPDGPAAVEIVGRGGLRPDLILADFNLPGGSDGLAVSVALRVRMGVAVPVIVLTGDISTATLREVANQDFVQLNKPVKTAELTQLIQSLLGAAGPPATPVAPPPPGPSLPVVYVVDDDRHVRDGLGRMLVDAGFAVNAHASCEAFLAAYRTRTSGPDEDACLLVDACLPGMGGVALLQTLREAGSPLPAIVITGNSDVPMAVQAMKAGASDFIEKPVKPEELLASVARMLELSRDAGKLVAWHAEAAGRVGELTQRQREVMTMVLAGSPSKNIAADLGISQRTVENHRAAIMKKTGATSLPALARLAVAAAPEAGA